MPSNVAIGPAKYAPARARIIIAGGGGGELFQQLPLRYSPPMAIAAIIARRRLILFGPFSPRTHRVLDSARGRRLDAEAAEATSRARPQREYYMDILSPTLPALRPGVLISQRRQKVTPYRRH